MADNKPLHPLFTTPPVNPAPSTSLPKKRKPSKPKVDPKQAIISFGKQGGPLAFQAVPPSPEPAPKKKPRGRPKGGGGTELIDAHSRGKARAAPVGDGAGSGSAPIDLDALPIDIVDLSQSPVKPAHFAPAPSKPTHSFFAPRLKPTAAVPSSTPEGRGGLADQGLKEARWPCTREEAHCGFVPAVRERANPPKKQRVYPEVDRWASDEATQFWQANRPSSSSSALLLPLPPSPPPDLIPPFITNHPAFSRLHPSSPNVPNRFPPISSDLWTDKFRPRNTSEVIGNEIEAIYLRDWLVALEVKSSRHAPTDLPTGSSSSSNGLASQRGDRKRAIVRKVDKSRKKKAKTGTEETDWIVPDDEPLDHRRSDPIEEYPPFPQEEDPVEPPNPTLDNRTFNQAPVYPRLSTHLTLSNSILLVGPPGAGKTASVYACAGELGWEVFEVYPGGGKRSGLALAEMVGEVGRNHLVGKGGTGGGAGSLAAAAKKKRKEVDALGSNLKKAAGGNAFSFLMSSAKEAKGIPESTSHKSLGSQQEPIDLDRPPDLALRDGSPVSIDMDYSLNEPSETKGKIRQSLILLEEVDVLYEEDKGFWPAVVSLISESRRPVVMTCNDPSTIPLLELPLQATLVYLPPPTYLAIPYLEQIAHHQSSHPSSSSLASLYTSQIHRALAPGLTDLVGHPAPSQPRDTPDLRRSINALQLFRSRSEQYLTYSSTDPPHVHFEPLPQNEEAHPVEPLDASSSLLDTLSFADAHLDFRLSTLMDRLEIDRYASSADDEVGYEWLEKVPVDPVGVRLSEVGREGEMARAVIDLGMGRARSNGKEVEGFVDVVRQGWPLLETDRLNHLDKLLTILEPLILPPAPLLPSKALIVDYVPFIHHIVLADDHLAKVDEVQQSLGFGRGRDGRMMRASALAGMLGVAAALRTGAGGRVAYQRWLWQLEEGKELEAARSVAFPSH